MNTVYEWYRWAKQQLEQEKIEDAAFEAQMLVLYAFGLDRQALLLQGETVPQPDQIAVFSKAVNQRIQRDPLQYILGEWEFYGRPFFVGEGVLVPRDETTLLVDAAKNFCNKKASVHILDLCAGSGAIAVSCKKEIPGSVVTACELSDRALAYLEKNAVRNEADINIVRCDVLSKESASQLPMQDVILSNPPYITSNELQNLQPEVQKEPQMALDGGADGLVFYYAITEYWLSLLKPGGLLAVECGQGQAHTIKQMFELKGLTTSVLEDLAGIPRIVCGQKGKNDCNF